MNHQPLVADALKQIGGEDARFDRLIVLPTGEMLGADYPTQVTRDLNLDVGQFELHGKGVGKALVEAVLEESRTAGQSLRRLQPGWMQVTYSR